MRQPSAIQLGEYGEDQALALFSGLGWGPLKTNNHDLGTDLFIQLRDDELTDLRMLLGAQVKTGPSWFSEPGTMDGREGWWYRESDKKHAEYWVNHHVPHILILQTADMTTRVWTVLDATTVENTGVGIKVFVPADQVLDASWKPHWIEIVAEARKLISFEGARWTFSITQVPEDAWARYALLTPRLVAPHRNRGYSADINWAEAIATCADGEPDQWDRFASQRDGVPSVTEAATHSDPGWRLASAVCRWVMGDAEGLEGIETTDFPRHLAVARAVCAAIAATDRYDLDTAATLLINEAIEGELSADQVWIAVHLAHVRRLQGDLDASQSLLEDALVASAALSMDITTSALRSACILGLFELAPMATGDVGSAVTAADNSASWWRTQALAYGLETDARKRFKKWAGDRSIVIGGTASAHNRLFSVAFTARITGDFGGWRTYSSLLAQTDLVTPPDGAAKVGNSLDSMRQCGDKKSLELAINKVRADGPLQALAELAAVASPDHATSLSIDADLKLLAVAGEHFNGNQARPWLDLLVEALTEPGPFYTRFAIQHWDVHEIVSALVGLRRHFTVEDQIAIVGFARSLADDTSQILEAPLSRLLHNLDPTILDEQLAIYDTEVAPSSWPRKLFRDLLAPRSPRVRQSVREALLSGDLSALSGANDVTRIESDEASVLLDKCDAAFDEYKQPSNGIVIGGQDYYRLAMVLALNGPEAMRLRAWAAIVAAIAEPIDVPERKYSAIKIIAGHADQVPQPHREAIVAAARGFRSAPPSSYADRSSGLKHVGPVFTELLLEMDPHTADWSDLLAILLAGDSEARRGACDVMGRRPGHEATLLALTRDADQKVAIRAARGLAQRVSTDADLSAAFASQLLRLTDQAGESLPFAILDGISTGTTTNDETVALLMMLLEHGSPAVRDDTAQLISDRGWQVQTSDTGRPT